MIVFIIFITQPIYGYGSLEDMTFRSTVAKDGEIFFVDDKEIGLREMAMNVAVPTDSGQRTVKGNNCLHCLSDCIILDCILPSKAVMFCDVIPFTAV